MKRIIARKKDFEYVLFPYLPRPLNNESESHVLETLGYLLKKVTKRPYQSSLVLIENGQQ